MADNGTTDTLTARQEKALIALLSAPSVRQAAEEAKIPEKTIYNWLKTTEFQAAYRAARRESVQQGIARLQYGVSVAVNGLIYLAAKARQESVRRAACRDILDLAIGAVELEDVMAQIAALRAQVETLRTRHE